jgi:hypothetical protein
MSRISHRLAVLALLVALAATAAACGSSDSSADKASGADAATLLRDTFGADHPIRSGRVDADLDVTGVKALGNQPLSLHLNGPFQTNGGKELPDFALGVDFQGGDNPVTVGAVFAQGGGYLTIEGQAFDLGSDLYKSFKTGYEKAKADAAGKDKAAAADQPTLAALGISPLRWLTDPKNVGTEDIAGTQTAHVASGVDVPKLLDDISTLLGKAKGVTGSTGASVPTELTAAQRDQLAKSIKSAKVDVWTGAKDHTLRKVAVNVQTTTGHVIFDITLAQLNQRQTIRKPAGARPLSELRSALSQLGLVGASSSAPSTTSTTPDTAGSATTPAAPSGTQADYAGCITAAGEDLTKVQACAKYLK